MNQEEWRPVHYPGFGDRFEVSDRGRVRGLWFRGKARTEPLILKPFKSDTGHLYVNLINSEEHKRTTPLRRGVHQLVAGAFTGPMPAGLETRHLDGDPSNNTPANLAYGTRSENVQDALRHGTLNPGNWKNRKRNK